MARVKVQLSDNVKRVVRVDTAATEGATLGTNLYLNDAVVTPAAFRNWLGIGSAGNGTAHRDLSGLRTGDDHPQYPMWAGNERITGQWQWTKALRGPDGTAATPAFSFSSDPATGAYLVGENNIGLSTDGTLRWDISTTAVTSTLPRRGPSGSDAAPTYAFTASATTGLYYTSGTLHVSIVGTTRLSISAAGTDSEPPFRAPNGTASAPAYTFYGDTGVNTGWYRVAEDTLGLSTNGTLRWSVSTATITITLPQLGPNGLVGTPAYSFSGDPNTGLYSVGADALGLAAGGVLALEVGNSYADVKGQPRWTGAVSPTVLATGSTNDYAPTGLAGASVLRLDTDVAGSTLSGLTGGVAGRMVWLLNIGAVGALTLTNEDAASAAANRFLLASGTASVIAPGGSVLLWYDGASSRWRHLGRLT